MLTDVEPSPRAGPAPWRAVEPDVVGSIDLSRNILVPEVSFLAILQARESGIGGPVGLLELSSLLWHATALRNRRQDGRFGIPWESRPAPSAGGLHPTRIVCLPVGGGYGGLYDPDRHRLLRLRGADPDAPWNARNVLEIAGANAGVTLQLAADRSKVAACYNGPDTLMWRDAGALAATLCLVATALGLTSVVLGRHGTEAVLSAGLPSRFGGVGAVHVGMQFGQAVSA